MKVREEKGLLEEVKKRKISKYCHWKRRPKSLMLTIIEGKTPGNGRRGRRRMSWMDNINRWSDIRIRIRIR